MVRIYCFRVPFAGWNVNCTESDKSLIRTPYLYCIHPYAVERITFEKKKTLEFKRTLWIKLKKVTNLCKTVVQSYSFSTHSEFLKHMNRDKNVSSDNGIEFIIQLLCYNFEYLCLFYWCKKAKTKKSTRR